MSSLVLIALFALASVQRWAEFFKAHERKVDWLSLTVAALAWFMFRMAYHRIKSEKWINYLGWTFFLLGAIYLFKLLWFAASLGSASEPQLFTVADLFTTGLSAATNLACVAAARDIQNRKPLFPDLSRWFHRLRGPSDQSTAPGKGKAEPLIPLWCWVFGVTSVAGSIAVYVLQDDRFPVSANNNPMLFLFLGNIVDATFSVISLAWLGYVIFSNLSNRRHPWIASLAIMAALVYAVVQMGFGLSPILATHVFSGRYLDSVALLNSSLTLLALPLKVFLFFFAYRLMVRLFETLSDLRELQDTGFDRRQDYLSSDGVISLINVRLQDHFSIRERLQNYLSSRKAWQLLDERPSVTIPQEDFKSKMEPDEHEYGRHAKTEFTERGFVNLVVKLPGEKHNRVVCIFWPNKAKEKRPKTFDWQPRLHKFSYFEPEKDKITDDDRKNKEIVAELMKSLPLASVVLTNRERNEIIWPEDDVESLERIAAYKGRMRAVANVAIQAQGAAIGCLQIGRTKSPFSQMAIRQIREIANLLSPAVQAYRELAGLDLMSIRFAGSQAEESTYSPALAAHAITGIVHDIFAPTVTRLCIDFGFSTLKPATQAEVGQSHVIDELEEGIKDCKWHDIREDFTDSRFIKYRLLKKGLTARVTETLSHQLQAGKPDRFTMGNLVLAVDVNKDSYDHAALGTTYLHRKTASTLAADAFLDFERDYYNDLLKTLGKELSEKRLNIVDWFEPIQRILTKNAGLTWVVAWQQGKEWLGDKEAIEVVQDLKHLAEEVIPYETQEALDTQYCLAREQFNSTNHVLKLKLENADAFIWFGVERKGFKSELEFASPWKNFLVNFGQIADASLARITFPEKFQLHLEAAQLQGIITSMATTGMVTHQFHSMIAGQLGSIRTLLRGFKLGELKGDEEHRQLIQDMNDTATQMLDVFQIIDRFRPSDERRPCQLSEVAEYAFRLYEVALRNAGIETKVEVDENIFVDVPFNVAALALATLVGNSKDALREKRAAGLTLNSPGTIRIEAKKEKDLIVCRVIDNGKGITSEVLSRIFDPKQSTKKIGTGMGLFLTSQSLIENRSSIEVTRSDENGSEFTIKFPLATQEVAV